MPYDASSPKPTPLMPVTLIDTADRDDFNRCGLDEGDGDVWSGHPGYAVSLSWDRLGRPYVSITTVDGEQSVSGALAIEAFAQAFAEAARRISPASVPAFPRLALRPEPGEKMTVRGII
jgi:hypothetical protein